MGEYDLIIIGGGIHGVGVAQAGAAAGYRTVLLERQALAAGTSSRSSKLIHGGLRYLEYGQVGLVREMLRERELLLKNAPDLVHSLPFYIPIYRDSGRSAWRVRLGLELYGLLGGGGYSTVPQGKWPEQDGLQLEGLQTVLQYRDAQTDDLRLTGSVMHSAESLGAELLCPASFIEATAGKESVQVTVEQNGSQSLIQGRVLVNAAGPWVNQVLGRIYPEIPILDVDLVKGTHIELDAPAVNGVYYLESKEDRRAVFVMPWHDRILVGTTESLHEGGPGDLRPRPGEISYLRQVVADYFPQIKGEMVGQFAGLRVLPAGSVEYGRRSRKVILHVSGSAPRVLSIYGGKLTNYRATAEKVLARLQPLLPERKRIAVTSDIHLSPVAQG